MSSNKNKAFTLVELIVVIVILAILATIAFLSFSSQSGSARDSVRLSDTTNIRKGLELRQAVSGVLPIPASITKTSIGGANSVTITEGVINNSVLKELSNGIKDPSGTEYKYSTISQGGSQPLYYQLALELENPTLIKSDNFNPFSEVVFAESKDTSKVAQLKGNYMFDPSIPSLFVLSGSTASASGGIYNPNLCFVIDKSTVNTFSNKDNCIPKNQMDLKDHDSSLVAYWDMETLTSSGMLKDLSGNGYNGKCYNDTLDTNSGSCLTYGPTRSSGAMFFDGGGKNVRIMNSTGVLAGGMQLTITAIVDGYCDYSDRNCIVLRTGNSGVNVKSLNYPKGLVWSEISTNNNTYKGTVGTENAISNYRSLITTTYDGNVTKVFRNGKNIGQNKWNGTISNSTSDYYIGKACDTDNRTFSGIIDDLKIYNRAMSDSEILQQAKSAGF